MELTVVQEVQPTALVGASSTVISLSEPTVVQVVQAQAMVGVSPSAAIVLEIEMSSAEGKGMTMGGESVKANLVPPLGPLLERLWLK